MCMGAAPVDVLFIGVQEWRHMGYGFIYDFAIFSFSILGGGAGPVKKRTGRGG